MSKGNIQKFDRIGYITPDIAVPLPLYHTELSTTYGIVPAIDQA